MLTFVHYSINCTYVHSLCNKSREVMFSYVSTGLETRKVWQCGELPIHEVFKPGTHQLQSVHAWFLEMTFVREVST